MEKLKIIDNLKLSKDKDILKIINNEKIYYSESIVKINQVGKNQERNFILTNKYIYNFKKKSMKRKIPLNSILGLSYSSISDEFIIHGKNEQYDYIYISENKILIICLILILYQELEDIKIPICQINEKSLKKYVTYEKDKKRNRQITKMDLSFQIDTKLFIETNRQMVEKEEIVKKIPEKNYNNLRMLSYSDFNDFVVMESKIKIEHFQLIKEIKRDIFGPIIIGKYLKDNKIYLLKSINKVFLIEKNIIENKAFEKNILQKMDFPFIDKMSFCFQNEGKIFFGFNYIKTTTIYDQLCHSRFFNEDIVKFYASIIGLTLDFLHKNKIIYRDFNLKNILINEDGYLIFNNFFNSKSVEEQDINNTNYYGNIQYLAPEIIMGEAQTYFSDWWSYGIIIYEMLFGIPPFFIDDNNDDKLYDMIVNDEINFPKSNISAEAKDLLQKILIKDKNERLGYKGGFEVIKKHCFFKGIDFDNIKNKQIDSPFKPTFQEEKGKENNEENIIFGNINDYFNKEDNNETKLEFLKNNQDKFGDFYE